MTKDKEKREFFDKMLNKHEICVFNESTYEKFIKLASDVYDKGFEDGKKQ